MHKKIYFNDKPLFLTNAPTEEMKTYLESGNAAFATGLSDEKVGEMIGQMGEDGIRAGVFVHEDVEAVLDAFKKALLLIQAAGGLVHTGEGELLLIHRLEKWDLPKGKLDDGEDLQTCALREITEETGVDQLEAEGSLAVTYHTYHQRGQHILKESHWFLVRSPRTAVLTPQTDEDIDKCEWVRIEALSPYLESTHASILDVIQAGLKKLSVQKS